LTVWGLKIVGVGHVFGQLQVLAAAIGDVIRLADGQGLDGFGRLAGHAEISADTIDSPGPQADD
jgi:hypothetical protein